MHGGLPVAEDGAAYVRTSAEQGYILTPRALLLGVPVQAQGPGPLVLHRPELASTIHIVTSKYWQLEVSVSSISCCSYKDFRQDSKSCAAGLAGAVSRTATAPVDRVKMLLQVQDVAHALTIRQGWNSMVAEGQPIAKLRNDGL